MRPTRRGLRNSVIRVVFGAGFTAVLGGVAGQLRKAGRVGVVGVAVAAVAAHLHRQCGAGLCQWAGRQGKTQEEGKGDFVCVGHGLDFQAKGNNGQQALPSQCCPEPPMDGQAKAV